MPPPNQLQTPLRTGCRAGHPAAAAELLPGHPWALEMEVLLPDHSANSTLGALLGEVTPGLGWVQAGG